MTKRLHVWFSPSVHLSGRHIFFPIIISLWNFRSFCQWQKWCPYKRSRSEVKGQGQIPIYLFPGHNSSLNSHMMMQWCCLAEVPYYFSRSSSEFQGRTAIKIDFDTHWAFLDYNSDLNSLVASKWCTELDVLFIKAICQFQSHMGKSIDFDPNCAFSDCSSSSNSLMAMKWCKKLEAW